MLSSDEYDEEEFDSKKHQKKAFLKNISGFRRRSDLELHKPDFLIEEEFKLKDNSPGEMDLKPVKSHKRSSSLPVQSIQPVSRGSPDSTKEKPESPKFSLLKTPTKEEESFRNRSSSFQTTLFGAKLKKSNRSSSVETVRPRTQSFVQSSIEVSKTEFNGTGQINNYTIIREIGKGSFGTVKEALNTEDGKKYAIKVLSKSRLRKSKLKFNVNRGPRAMGAPHPRSSSSGNNEKLECKVEIKVENKTEKVEGYDDLDELKVEIAILKKISKHPYFVRLVEVLSSDQDDHVYMVFDLCERGAIMKMSSGKEVSHFSEKVAQRYFRQLILAIEFLHFHKIVHRDIKPENILLNANDEVQLADFGVSHMFDGPDDWLNNSQGSPAFCAPEVCSATVSQYHGKAVDVWAIGITLYCFIFGRCPFESPSIAGLYKQIIHDEVKFPHQINPYLQHLLQGMLEKDPEKRITISDIKIHPWTTDGLITPLPSTDDNCHFDEVTAEEVKNAVKRVKVFRSKIRDLFRSPRKRHDFRSSDDIRISLAEITELVEKGNENIKEEDEESVPPKNFNVERRRSSFS